MTLWSDPKYIALAKVAAAGLGTSNGEIVAAILAQWTCEKGNADAYPPSRNNPGNLARGAAQGLGFPFHVDYPNPQPANPIVTFQTPTYGARAYAKLLSSGSRYAGVRAAVKAGNGSAFIAAMGASGYGTSVVCMLSAYHPPAPAPHPPHPPTGDDMVIPQSLGHIILTEDAHLYSGPNLGAELPTIIHKGSRWQKFGGVPGWQFILVPNYGGGPHYMWVKSDQVDPDPEPLCVSDGPCP